MRSPGMLVVAGWAALNVVLAAGLLGAGGYGQEFGIYFAAIGLAVLFAVAVAWSRRRRPNPASAFRLVSQPGAALLGAGGLVMVGLGLVYGWWFGVLAVPLLGWALVDGFRGMRHQPPL